MTAVSVQLGNFVEWADKLEELSADDVRSHLSEIKSKFRNMVRLKSEVDILQNQEMSDQFTALLYRVRQLRGRAQGQADQPPPLVDTSNSATPLTSPKSDAQNGDSKMPDVGSLAVTSNNEQEKAVCKFGSECDSTVPKHFYDFIHYDHPREEDMIDEYEEMLEEENRKAMFSKDSGWEFLTEAQRAEQIAMLGEYNATVQSEEESESSEDEMSTRSGRRRRRFAMKKKEAVKKAEDREMTEEERQVRLHKLLKKTENFMRTLTMRIRKNYKKLVGADAKDEIVSTAEVRDFLNSGMDDRVIEQTESLVGGTLKDYQQIGLRWMVSLNEMRLNGILADEMGLGKTVQIMSLLSYVKDVQNTLGPHLIVIPLSTLSSWMEHFEKWAPSFRVYPHRGSPEERRDRLEKCKNDLDFDVLITTYEMCIRDEELLRPFKWCYLVVDEAHRLKNKASRLFGTLNSLSTKHRMLLTGTPLQNNLNELWSLLHFILPDVFDSVQSFESWFCMGSAQSSDVITDEERLLVVDRLHRAIDPFLLRRVKVDVLPDMVKKEEVVLKCRMSGMQMSIYRHLQEHSCLQSKGKIRNNMNILMELRKCSNHPFNFQEDEYVIDESICSSSGKFVMLDHLIPKMLRFNHRMLIFFQYKVTMDIASEYLDWKQLQYLRIDGEVKSEDRIDFLNEFNTKESEYSIFLLSTRACGLGLNLYSADTVILFDSDWNPQMDLQAQARAHRIGQTREVRIFRFLTEQSVEETIFERAQKKLDLERKAIEAGRFDFSMTSDERKEFLQNILKQRLNDDHLHCVLTDRHEINCLLARTEEEVSVFDQMDTDEKFVQLDSNDQLPNWLEQYNPNKRKKKLPKKRRRKKVTYNEVPSDYELMMMEKEADEAQASRPKRKCRKRKESPTADELTREPKRRRLDVDSKPKSESPKGVVDRDAMDVDEEQTDRVEQQCGECGRTFSSFADLENHVATECTGDFEMSGDDE